MKIKLSTIENINIGFPAEWKAQTYSGETALISYRHGQVKFFIDDKLQKIIDGPQGAFDVGGTMHDKQLVAVLRRDNLVAEGE